MRDYLPNHFHPAEQKQLSLREAALIDARARGITSEEFARQRRQRRLNWKPGKKTNIGNPCDRKR